MGNGLKWKERAEKAAAVPENICQEKSCQNDCRRQSRRLSYLTKKKLSDRFFRQFLFCGGISLIRTLYGCRGENNAQHGTGQKKGEKNSHNPNPYHPLFRFFLFRGNRPFFLVCHRDKSFLFWNDKKRAAKSVFPFLKIILRKRRARRVVGTRLFSF